MRRTTPAVALGLSALLVAPLSARAAAGHTSATTLGYVAKNSSFYDLNELERCFGRKA